MWHTAEIVKIFKKKQTDMVMRYIRTKRSVLHYAMIYWLIIQQKRILCRCFFRLDLEKL